jgi:hypothetical protein
MVFEPDISDSPYHQTMELYYWGVLACTPLLLLILIALAAIGDILKNCLSELKAIRHLNEIRAEKMGDIE